MNPFSRLQKIEVGSLATRAWQAWAGREAWCAEYRADVDPLASNTACFQAWRHAEQFNAVGIAKMRECDADAHFLRLCAHFQNIIGQGGRALKTLLHHEDEPTRRLLHLIEQSCRERGLAFPAYPAAICRRQFRCELADAAENQLRSLHYTVRNRRAVGGQKYPAGKFARPARAQLPAAPANFAFN